MAKKKPAKKPLGRPAGEPREKTGYRLPVDLMARVRAAAGRADMSITDWIVAALESYCQKKP